MHSVKSLPLLVQRADAAFKAPPKTALQELATKDSFGLELLLAGKHQYGESFVTWEPESIWLLHDLSSENRDKLQAARTVATHATLFEEPRGFAAVSQALSGYPLDATDLQATPVEAMAWGALEGALIFALSHGTEPGEYSPDVVEFVALSLANQGFVLAPESLDFADDRLAEHLTDEGRVLREKARSAWDALPDENLAEHKIPDTAEGVQLARLAAVQLHCDELAADLASRLR